MVPVDPNKAADIPQVPNGTTLILTLNRDLQAATEQILDEFTDKIRRERRHDRHHGSAQWRNPGYGIHPAHGLESILELSDHLS